MWPFANNWGNWKDVGVEEVLGNVRILQARKNLKTGKKQLRVESIFFNGLPENVDQTRKNIWNI
jgi:hypothetical protein